jgi:glycosyltransferase involved in cell wall biosynthesis
MDHANFAAILARQWTRVSTRVVASVHTSLTVKGVYTDTWLDRNTGWVGRALYPRADHIIAVSRAVADELASSSRLDPATITVVPNPVELKEISDYQAVAPEHPFLAGNELPPLVAVGRLSFEKGFDVLIRAHALLLKQRRIRLLILGEGNERPHLEALVRDLGSSEYVDLPGFVESPVAFFARASVVVMPSRVEGFGNALVEAMGCGIPVVATRCQGGPVEILDGGRFGPLAAPDDPADLARAIEDVLLNPVPAGILKDRARDFATGPVVDRYLQVLFPKEDLS